MRDQQHGPAAGGGEDVLDQPLGGRRVEVRGRLVEHEHRRVREQGAREDDPLALAARELAALLADERVEAVRERRAPSPQIARGSERVLDLGVARAGTRQPDVLADRGREQVRVLAGDGDRAADVLLAVRRAGRAPPSVTRPRSGSRNRSSRLATVVLPAPLGPSSATAAPGSSRRLKPSSAGGSPGA